jgi:F420H(2)-dependent quinone reductase
MNLCVDTSKGQESVRKLFRAIVAMHVAIYRLTSGRIGGRYRFGAGLRQPADVLLLEHVGRTSGKSFVTPVIFTRDGAGNLIVAGSQGGLPTNPNWYLNLVAAPDTHIQIGRRRIAVRARTAKDGERDELWIRLVEAYADFADYQRRTDRQIPVVVFDPRPDPAVRRPPPGIRFGTEPLP